MTKKIPTWGWFVVLVVVLFTVTPYKGTVVFGEEKHQSNNSTVGAGVIVDVKEYYNVKEYYDVRVFGVAGSMYLNGNEIFEFKETDEINIVYSKQPGDAR